MLDLCKETKTVLTYPSCNLRVVASADVLDLSTDTNPVNYVEDQMFILNYPLLNGVELFEIRFGWQFIKRFNNTLSDTLRLIKVQPQLPSYFQYKWLSYGTSLSTFHSLIMIPIKSEIMSQVLKKTALQREHAPAIELEKEKIAIETLQNLP